MFGKGMLAVFLAAGIASFLSAQSLPPVSISVHTDAGAAVQGAVVQVERDGQSVARAASGADGKAEIPALLPGEYKISITQEGFEQSVQSIVVRDARQEVEIDVVLVSKLR